MVDTITPEQCRGSRAMLGMSQTALAEAARVGLSTIQNFEAGRSVPNAKNMADIIAALVAAGVEFIEQNGGGPGVRLAAPSRPGAKRRREDG
jgi:DNA-binding XRE family transcriptional regulator